MSSYYQSLDKLEVAGLTIEDDPYLPKRGSVCS